MIEKAAKTNRLGAGEDAQGGQKTNASSRSWAQTICRSRPDFNAINFASETRQTQPVADRQTCWRRFDQPRLGRKVESGDRCLHAEIDKHHEHDGRQQ